MKLPKFLRRKSSFVVKTPFASYVPQASRPASSSSLTESTSSTTSSRTSFSSDEGRRVSKRVMSRSTLPSPDFVAAQNKSPEESEHVRMYARAYGRAQAYAAAFEDGREQRQTFRAIHQGARFVYENVASPNSSLPDCPHDWEIW